MTKPLEQWWHSFLEAAQEDEYRWLLGGIEVAGGAALDGLGHHLATTKLEVLSLILAYRRLDHADESDPTAFLRRQQYGGPPDDAGAQYCLTIMGPGPPVGIVVTEIDEIDLEDLYNAMEFESLTVQNLGGTLDESAIDRLVEQIVADLSYGENEFDFEVAPCEDDASFTLFLTAK